MSGLHDRPQQRYVPVALTHTLADQQIAYRQNENIQKWKAFGLCTDTISGVTPSPPVTPSSDAVTLKHQPHSLGREELIVDDGHEHAESAPPSRALCAIREQLLSLSARVGQAKEERSCVAPRRTGNFPPPRRDKHSRGGDGKEKEKNKDEAKEKDSADGTRKERTSKISQKKDGRASCTSSPNESDINGVTASPDAATTGVVDEPKKKKSRKAKATNENSNNRRTLFTMPPPDALSAEPRRAAPPIPYRDVEDSTALFDEMRHELADPNRIQAPTLFLGFITRDGESNFSISAKTHGKVHFVRGVNPDRSHLALQSVVLRWMDDVFVLPAMTALPFLVRTITELVGVEIVTFNAPSLLLILLSYRQGNLFTSCVSDVRIMAWMLQSAGGVDEFTNFEVLLQSRHQQIGFSTGFPQAAADTLLKERVCRWVYFMAPLYRTLYGQLGAQGLLPGFLKQEKRISLLCSIMKLNGMWVNVGEVESFKARCAAQMEAMRTAAQRLVPSISNFNLQSHDQCREAIYEVLLLGKHLTHVEADGNSSCALTVTKCGRLSTSEETLRLLAPHHELPRVIIAYRKAAKLLQTYTEGLMETAVPMSEEQENEFADKRIESVLPTPQQQQLPSSCEVAKSDENTNIPNATTTTTTTTINAPRVDSVAARKNNIVKLVKLHANFIQEGTETGRLSCVEPNLQNLPRPTRKVFCASIDTDLGTNASETKDATPSMTTEFSNVPIAQNDDEETSVYLASFRRCFVAPPEYSLLSIDYEQIELRVLAHLSADAALVDALTRTTDIHRTIAETTFRKSPVSDEERSLAKRVVFGILYGAGPRTLATQMGVTVERALHVSSLFKASYPHIERYHHRVIDQCRVDGFVRTLSGRIRNLPEINDNVMGKRSYAERQAFNTVIQGSAADVMKLAMLAVERDVLRPHWQNVRLLAQIHDEIVLAVPTHMLRAIVPAVSHSMTHAVSLLVPLRVTAKVGRSLGELEEWSVEHELGIREPS